MQNYIDIARKNGITLKDSGQCQFCGASTLRGIHECLEIFNIGFQSMEQSGVDDHLYRFFIVDAHCLQHPEIQGRWSNHFHLSRLHLIIHYKVNWTYDLSSKLSEVLNEYKILRQNEFLAQPAVFERGKITSTDIQETLTSEELKNQIMSWAKSVYSSWKNNHELIDELAIKFQ